MKTLILTILTFITASAYAGVPHSFESGSPARAAHVNENFESLDSDIQSVSATAQNLNNRTGDLETTVADVVTAAQSMGNRVSTVESNLVTLDTKTTTLETSVTTLDTDISTMGTTVTAIDSDLATVESVVTAIDSDLATLESTVATLETDVASMETGSGACLQVNDLSQKSSSVSYNFIYQAPGTIVSLNNGGTPFDYTIVRVPFVDYANNAHYMITFPYLAGIPFKIYQVGDECFGDFTIDSENYPAKILFQEYTDIDVDPVNGGWVTQDYIVVEGVYIKVGNTLIFIEFEGFYSSTLDSGVTSPGDGDYYGDIDTLSKTRWTAGFSEIDTFIDYINIEVQ